MIEKEGIEAADKVFPEYVVKDVEDAESILKDAKDFPKQTPPVQATAVKDAQSSFGEHNETTDSAPLENGEQDPQPTTPPHDEPTASIPEGHSSEAARLSEENAALKAENDALKADKLAAERLRAGAAFSETLDKAIADGRCNQVLKDNLMKVFGVFQEVPVDGEGCFGEGDDRVNVAEILASTVASLPKIVEFGEAPGMHDTPQLAAGEALARYKAEQESKGRVLSFAEAAEEYDRIKV